jgi:hypothetical protein
VAWRGIQARRGHQRPPTTARSTPLTPTPGALGQAPINARMAARSPRGGTGLPEGTDGFRDDGPASQARLGAALLPRHRRALAEIRHGRTAAWGGQLWPWDHGGQAHAADHACRHRSGPQGHPQDPEVWRAARRQARRPGPSGPGVLTLPQALHDLGRRHPQARYARWRRAAAQALSTRALDPPDVGGLLGVWGLLPTGPRPLTSQPPVHGRVPAGGVSADRTAWRPARPSSRVPGPALAKLVRGRGRALVRQERPALLSPEGVWPTGGVVYGHPAGQGTAPVRHDLGRELPRIALTNPRLRSRDPGPVGCRSQDAQAPRWNPMTWPAHECLRRVLPQGWPQGVPTVRSSGLWRPSPRPLLPPRHRGLAGPAAAPPPTAPEPTPQAPAAWGRPLRAGHPWPSWGQGLLVVIRALPRRPRGPP